MDLLVPVLGIVLAVFVVIVRQRAAVRRSRRVQEGERVILDCAGGLAESVQPGDT